MAGTSGKHIVLVGDSVFDNRVYVKSDPLGEGDVTAQLTAAVANNSPAGPCEVTRVAVDGAVSSTILRDQLVRIPASASHLFLSAGGNDALHALGLLDKRCSNVMEALQLLSAVARKFQANYRELVNALVAKGLPLCLCTIYKPCLDKYDDPRITMFNLATVNKLIPQAQQPAAAAAVQKITELGFTEAKARRALRATEGNVDMAVEMLLADTVDDSDEDETDEALSDKVSSIPGDASPLVTMLSGVASVALAALNGIIMDIACEFGLPVLRLDLIFTSPNDYANQIEPACCGGRKIVEQILRVVATHDFDQKVTVLYK